MSEIILNTEQKQFVDLALARTGDVVLTGAAGSGKTTTQQYFLSEALKKSFPVDFGKTYKHHKYLKQGAPAILILSFTRTAVENIRRHLPYQELKDNCMTIHKVLEFMPVEKIKYDAALDREYTVMTFEPSRDATNRLPPLHTIVIEEASMVSEELFDQFRVALPNSPQIIFLGDLS